MSVSKIRKRLGKLKHLANQRDGVIATEKPSSQLVVGNIGLDNAVPRSQIEALFAPFGPVVLALGRNRSYAYVTFLDTDKAAEAKFALQGTSFSHASTGREILMVMLFVDRVPDFKEDISGVEARSLPEGLVLLKEFVSEDYERELIQIFTEIEEDKDCLESDPVLSQTLKHRRVHHFGYEFRYDTNDVDPTCPLVERPIPPACRPFIEKLLLTGNAVLAPDQLTVNRYAPGHGIPPHVDTHFAFEDEIFSLSLGSGVLMDFRSLVDGRTVSVFLPPRSLLILRDASRYAWTHGIAPRKSDVLCGVDGAIDVVHRSARTSLTFRRVLASRSCVCRFPDQCESRREEKVSPWQLESTHVHRVYEEIASHFSGTRHTPWPKVKRFVEELQEGSIVLDVGCGNGKYFGIRPLHSSFEIGCDRSLNLSSICSSRGFASVGADALSLPFREACFDAVISIAVIHHLATPQRRAAAIREMLRVARHRAKILVTVWAFEQRHDNVDSKYVSSKSGVVGEVKENVTTEKNSDLYGESELTRGMTSLMASDCVDVKQLLVHENRTSFKQQDVLVPWHLKSSKNAEDDSKRVFHRFYHIFKEGELLQLVTSLQDYHVNVIDSYYDQGNWCLIFQKL